MKLHFDVSACVRPKSKFSECSKCMDVCPDSITLQDDLPTFKKATGVEAAACVGVCPTEAFALSGFSTTEFFFTFLESKVRLISPKINVPCLSVLSVEHLISLALASDETITLDMSVYDEDSLRFEHIEGMRDKQLPNKRKILFTTLKRAGVPDVFETLPEEDVSIVSQKYIDESCTNCQICYRICPTGALSSNGKFSLIYFDAMLCVKCRLCHDACEPDAIYLQKGFEIKEFFEPTQRTLATFNVKRCNECGNYFTYTGGELTCPRCSVEEEEAMFLHENAKKMRNEK